MTMSTETRDRTIRDFGEQWTAFPDSPGWFESLDLLKDMLEPLVPLESVKDAKILDVGAGHGRLENMLFMAGAGGVTAVEPSDAFEVMKRNTARNVDKIAYVRCAGHEMDEHLPEGSFDLAISYGVIHHIPDPLPALRGMRRALKDGGRCWIWIYGREGNGAYLFFAEPLRWITRRMPHVLLSALSMLLTPFLSLYAWMCRWLPLPMRDYMRRVIAPQTWYTRKVTIYDQLNPAEARYYTRDEVTKLMADAGFTDIKTHHRHGYSWAVLGFRGD